MKHKKHICQGCHKKTLECLRTNPPHYKCPECGYEARFPKSKEGEK